MRFDCEYMKGQKIIKTKNNIVCFISDNIILINIFSDYG